MTSIYFISLLVAFQISLFVHIMFLASYVSQKKKRALEGFLITMVSNMLIGIGTAVFAFKNPHVIYNVNLDFIATLESGLFFMFFIFLKIRVTYVIYKRMQNPENYHISYFGKKVYNVKVATNKELAIYYLTFPVSLIVGAYFVTKVILM